MRITAALIGGFLAAAAALIAIPSAASAAPVVTSDECLIGLGEVKRIAPGLRVCVGGRHDSEVIETFNT
jgi:hypothetical protein